MMSPTLFKQWLNYTNFESIWYLATLKQQVNYTSYYWN